MHMQIDITAAEMIQVVQSHIVNLIRVDCEPSDIQVLVLPDDYIDSEGWVPGKMKVVVDIKQG